MKSSRMAFFVMGWIGMLLYFSQRWVFGPLIPSLMQEFHADKTALGVVGAAGLWGYMLTPIAAGVLSDRFGRKHAVLFGIFGFSILTVVCGFTNSTGQLFWGRFFTGMVEAFYFIPLIAFTMELFPERPGFFLTLMSSGSSLGWFTGPALAGWLLDFTGSWRAAFLVTGGAGIVVALLLLWVWPSEKGKERKGAFFDRALLEPSNLLMLLFLALVGTFQIASEFGFTMWYPVFLRTEAMMTATAAGVVVGFFGIGQCFGRPVMGWISDKLGYRWTGIAGSAAMVVSVVMILSVHSTTLRVFFTFTAGFIGAAVMGSLWTFTGLIFPSFKGLALGLIVTFAYCTGSFGPIAIGYIGDHYSVATGLWSVTLPSAVAAGLAFLPTFALRRGRGKAVAGDQ